jgi:ribosomal protein L16 Arg81 hydroxylase
MEKRIHNLASLLHPISLDTFFSTYWEKSFLLAQHGDDRYFEGLLTNEDLEDVISSSDARYPAIMLAKDGVFFPPQAYCEDVKMGQVTFSGVPSLKKLSAEYGKGATIVLTSLDRSWRPLSDLCMRLEEQLDHGIKTNVYITAGQTLGFPPHYDTHDILLLQIAGKKLWRIYEPTIKLPDVSQPCEPKSFSPGPRLMDIELHAGDLLYLPRGYGHAATTSESHSAHITVGIHVYTWAGALKELDPSWVRVEEFRKSLPPGFASRVELRPAMKEQLKRMVPGRFSDGTIDRVLDSTVRNVNQLRRRMRGRFRADAIVISAKSLLKTPPEDRYHLSRLIDDLNNTAGLTLDFNGSKYSFPAQLEVVLNAMCGRASFRLQELPGGLNSDAIVDLASYLQSIGFLTSSG